MTRVLAVTNQKGGVAKTTTTYTLGAAMAEAGRRVLLVDLDPQACLTYSMGVEPDTLERSLHDVLLDRCGAAEVMVSAGGLDLLPANIDLAGTEVFLLSKTGREYGLKKALAGVADDYDLVLIDCPPSLGILTINGLTAAQEIIIPLQCETLSHRGVGQLMETIDDVRSFTNPDLHVLGVVATMFDARTNLTRDVIADIPKRYGLTVLNPPIPKSVKVAEAPQHGRSILDHAPRSKPAEAYRELATGLFDQAEHEAA